MKLRVPSLLVPLLLLPGALVHAAMTAGWQLPIQAFGISPNETEGVRKLDKPPSASPFFRPGDELWDLSGVIKGSSLGYINAEPFDAEPAEPEKWPGQWVVWNARSGMIVARGEKPDLGMIDMIVEARYLPKLLRTKVEMVNGADGKTASASLASRSGEKGSMISNHSEMVVEGTIGDSDYVDERLALKWSAGETNWTLNCAFTVRDGERVRIARHTDATGSWELFATPTVEYLHGVPVASSRWQESAGALAIWPRPAGGDPPELNENGLVVGMYHLAPDWLERLGADRGKLPTTEVPAFFDRWAKEPVVDARNPLREKGFKLSEPGAFAGFQTSSGRLFTATNLEDWKLLQVLVDGGCHYLPVVLWIEASASGGESCGVVSRSGEKATLMSSRGEEERVFEIEPTIGSGDFIVDLRFRSDIEMSPGKFQRLESTASLLRDQPLPIAGLVLPGKEEQKVTLVARYKTQEEKEKEHR
ncbi:hypothetical protein [Haloferula sp. BvORR071]|uniref:hypothetical protein n=1 Tax=Haloferula sp. BvORR071 TaxID=1396141 RepID=UPI00055876E5|nr:hypothetical protein [Haloferula sp. BvORR071]